MQPHLDPTDCSQGREKKKHLLWYPLSRWSQGFKQPQSNTRLPGMQPGAKQSFAEPSLAVTEHRLRFCCCFWSPCTDMRKIRTLPTTYRWMPALKKVKLGSFSHFSATQQIYWLGRRDSLSLLTAEVLCNSSSCLMKFALYPHLLFGPFLASLKFWN